MISDKSTGEKKELSLKELEDITGGYICERANNDELSFTINILRMSGNIIQMPKDIVIKIPPRLPGYITVFW